MLGSVYSVVQKYNQNRDKIENYLKSRRSENFGLVRDDSNTDSTISGMSIGVFLILFATIVAIWIWAIVVLVKFWKVLPTWAQVVGLLGVIPVVPLVGPVATLIVVYATKP